MCSVMSYRVHLAAGKIKNLESSIFIIFFLLSEKIESILLTRIADAGNW